MLVEMFRCLGDCIAYNVQKMMDTVAWNKEVPNGKFRMGTGTKMLSTEKIYWKKNS